MTLGWQRMSEFCGTAGSVCTCVGVYAVLGFLCECTCLSLGYGIAFLFLSPATLKTRLLERLREADVLISSGGVSMGEKDYLKPTLEEIGATVHFGRVLMKPGCVHGIVLRL